MKIARKLACASVLALALPLAACSGDTGASSSEEGNSPTTETTIRYMNFTSNGGNEENLNTIIEAFNAENPNVKVEVTTLPYTDYFTALQTDLAGGTVADVFDIEYANYASYQQSGVLAPLEGVDTSVYQESLAQAYSTDGTPYALPISFSNVVLLYNKDLFDQAGVDYPDSTWTWSDEQEAAEKIRALGDGVWGDYQPISYNEYYKALAQAGGSLLNEDGTEATFDTPEGKRAAQWLVDKSGTTMPSAEQGVGTPDFDTNLFTEGKLGMWHTGIWTFGSLADVPFDWDIAVEPGDSQKASALFSNAVGVYSGSKSIEAATKFAQFLSGSETVVDVRLESGWELPTIADQAKLAPYLEIKPPESKQVVFDSLENVVLAPSIGDAQAQMQDVITEELSEAAAGRASVDEALRRAQQRVNELLK